ncbi:MAG: hypothetical protein JWM92_127 [Candidatus Nomurabacteria bacterium]|jgi:hypothetical protein|nr:hypothetical protein [Candidatus Nomurabacteria bacterium]
MNLGTVFQVLNILVVIVGIPLIVNLLMEMHKKLPLLDRLNDAISNDIQHDLKNLQERLGAIEDGGVKTFWKDEVAPAGCPRQLNIRGKKILKDSGIKEIIDAKKYDLLIVVKNKQLTNPYDAEQSILSTVNELKYDPVILEKLKTGAFNVGADIDTVLLVGGIYLRDLIFTELGFSFVDLDKSLPV